MQWYFLLRWPEGHVFSGEPLKLCFEDEEEAQCWRDALVTSVSGGSEDLHEILAFSSLQYSLQKLYGRPSWAGRSNTRHY